MSASTPRATEPVRRTMWHSESKKINHNATAAPPATVIAGNPDVLQTTVHQFFDC